MVWTKDEVDKYVIQVERNCASAHEVSCGSHSFPRSFFDRLTLLLTYLAAQLEGVCLCKALQGSIRQRECQTVSLLVSFTLPVQ